MSAVAHFFMSVAGSKIHERLAHFFIDIYNGLGYIFKTLRVVPFASANCSAHKVRRR